MENVLELKKFLAIPRDIVLTTHRNPDGDAVGSSLGLYHFLTGEGHAVHMCVPSEYPTFLSWMPGIDQMVVYDTDPERTQELIERAQVIFALDYNALDRIDKMGELIGDSRAKKVMIDHHLYPEDFAEYELSETNASSTCELIYDFIEMMGMERSITPLVGDCLFTGILTDTGSFKYSTSPKLFRIVANLLELGVDDVKIQGLVFNCLEEKNLRLLGHCLANRMEILPEFRTGIISLTKEDYEQFDIKRGDTEGIVNFLLKLKGVTVAAFIHEQPKITKISLRSKGDFSVQEIASKYFKGGGHLNASGGASFTSLASTIRKFKSILPEYQELLTGEKNKIKSDN
ncbi:MAG: bifunctional oligoribonuclease/PAP phosphatase NrnA [Saprospiraceae bacterium]|nr:bifunctional oligoribonuclease/PAP phosphatase NrnA [Saprospiraceae bacterium]